MLKTTQTPSVEWMQWMERRLEAIESNVDDLVDAWDPMLEHDEPNLTFGTDTVIKMDAAMDHVTLVPKD